MRESSRYQFLIIGSRILVEIWHLRWYRMDSQKAG